MGDLATWFQEGGSAMLPIAALGALGGALGIVGAIAQVRGLALAALLCGALALALGVVSWQEGLHEVEQAIATVSPEFHAEVRVRGNEIAHIPLELGLGCLFPGLITGVLALLITRGRPTPR